MTGRHPSRRQRRAVAAACGAAIAAIATAAAATAAPRHIAALAATPACTAANTQVWLGDGQGGGTAGTTFYPLEFTNVGHRACTLFGYPGVSAIRGGRQIGAAANRSGGRHRTVTLRPGTTAHALLGIHDWGAICSTQAKADGLRVFAPGQRAAKEIDFPFGACAHRGVLTVGPIRAGVGIPGYTTS